MLEIHIEVGRESGFGKNKKSTQLMQSTQELDILGGNPYVL